MRFLLLASLLLTVSMVAAQPSAPLTFNISRSGSISSGSSVSFSLQNTIDATSASASAFFVQVSSPQNCTIRFTVSNSDPTVPPWVESASFPGSLPIFYYTPFPNFGSLAWTIELQGIDDPCQFSIVARNMPAQPITFGQTLTYTNIDPDTFLRYTTLEKDAGHPFPAMAATVGVNTLDPTMAGCVVTINSDPQIGGAGETTFVFSLNNIFYGLWGIYDDSTVNGFYESVTGFYPSNATPLSLYVRASLNWTTPCPSFNLTLSTVPPTPLAVGAAPLTLGGQGNVFGTALIFGPPGAQSYALVVTYVSGYCSQVGWAANDPATFTGSGSFQVIGGMALNSTVPSVRVPVSGTVAANYIWTVYVDSGMGACVLRAQFQ
jgi:hypothetical protein